MSKKKHRAGLPSQQPAANVTLRTLGSLLHSMVLEYWHFWPSEPEGHFRHQCRAVVADLRHLQGYVARLGWEQERLSLEPFEARLSRECPALSRRIQTLADALEKDLGAPQGDKG